MSLRASVAKEGKYIYIYTPRNEIWRVTESRKRRHDERRHRERHGVEPQQLSRRDGGAFLIMHTQFFISVCGSPRAKWITRRTHLRRTKPRTSSGRPSRSAGLFDASSDDPRAATNSFHAASHRSLEAVRAVDGGVSVSNPNSSVGSRRSAGGSCRIDGDSDPRLRFAALPSSTTSLSSTDARFVPGIVSLGSSMARRSRNSPSPPSPGLQAPNKMALRTSFIFVAPPPAGGGEYCSLAYKYLISSSHHHLISHDGVPDGDFFYP